MEFNYQNPLRITRELQTAVRCKISRLFRLHGNPPDYKKVPRGYLREVIRSVVKGAVPKLRLNRWHQTETARYLDKSTPGPRA